MGLNPWERAAARLKDASQMIRNQCYLQQLFNNFNGLWGWVMWATGTVSLRNVVLVAHTGPIWVDSVNIKFLSQVLDRWYKLDKKMCKMLWFSMMFPSGPFQNFSINLPSKSMYSIALLSTSRCFTQCHRFVVVFFLLSKVCFQNQWERMVLRSSGSCSCFALRPPVSWRLPAGGATCDRIDLVLLGLWFNLLVKWQNWIKQQQGCDGSEGYLDGLAPNLQ